MNAPLSPDPEPQRSMDALRAQGALGSLTREQIALAWDGIPESYWPDPEKPWRVGSGIGAFADFATREEAEAHYEHLLATLVGDWRETVNAPANIHDRTREMLAKAAS